MTVLAVDHIVGDGEVTTIAQCRQCGLEFEDAMNLPERCPGCNAYIGPITDNCRVTGGGCGE